MSELIVDGTDLGTACGFTLGPKPSGLYDRYEADWPAAIVPGRIGELLLSSVATYPARKASVPGFLSAADMSTLESYQDLLKWYLRPGLHEFGFPDMGTRILKAYVQGPVTITPHEPAYAQPKRDVSIPLMCYDPRIYAGSDTVTSVPTASGDVALALGTAPSSPSIAVDQATFTLTYKDHTGTTVATMEVSGASATPVTVDMAARTITSSAGSEVAALVSGRFFDLDPADGDFSASQWPTLAVSAGTATVTYRACYL